LHVSHPSIGAPEIAQHFAFPSWHARSVGEKRVTDTGKELGGVYQHTSVTFDVSGGVIPFNKQSLDDCVSDSLDQLPGSAIKKLVATGGECYYLVGVYSEENVMVYFSSKLLSALSESSIGLKLDFYGGPE